MDVLNGALKEVLADEGIKKRFADIGVEARSSEPQEIGKRLADDIAKWSSVIDRAGVPKQ
ncbi:hypothetical protein RvVAT039_pl06060 (plasmid) [Agrobacterium vitis]|nr:hypothetical protein BBL07_11620 [Agrobacterium vitis]BCH67773.1 hypothetical protein RvVAT039_pl06060 [Agrobacterium vitis]